ncbi:MAG TPA: hypothetical protein VN618_07950 [Solirubrobacteraceae bacterium]|nr:hypothetical protein [Solirubrobacteraceae bacterium]
MSRFEDRLFAELVEQHGALLTDAPARALPASGQARRPARVRLPLPLRLRLPAGRLVPAGALAFALAAALAAIVIGFGSGGGGGTPAYAVVSNGDGTVSVTVRELVGVTGANEALRTLGVRARVVHSERACPTQPGEYALARLSSEQSERIAHGGAPSGEPSVVLDPSAIPPGDTVVIGARVLEHRRALTVTGLEIAIYEGAVPPCLRAAGSG